MTMCCMNFVFYVSLATLAQQIHLTSFELAAVTVLSDTSFSTNLIISVLNEKLIIDDRHNYNNGIDLSLLID